MDILVAEGLNLIVILFVFLFLFFWWQNVNHKGQIPSPKGLPIIGHLLNLDPKSAHIILTKWSKDLGGILQIKIFTKKMVVLNSYNAIYEALITRKDIVAGRPDQQYRADLISKYRGILRANPNPKWKMIRNTCHRHLKLQGENRTKIEGLIQDLVGDLVEMFKKKEHQSFNPREAIHHFTISVTCALLVGRKYAPSSDPIQKIVHYQDLARQAMGSGANGMLLDAFPWLRHFGNSTYKKTIELLALQGELWSKMKTDAENNLKLVGENNTDAGLMGIILKLQGEDIHGVTVDDLDAEIVFQNLILAGILTTGNSVYALLNILSHHQRVLKNLQKEIDQVVGKTASITFEHRVEMPYTQATIHELLRYTSVAPLAIPHKTLENTTLQGYDIPAGTTVRLNLWALHHDECLWPDPFEFRPERFLDADGELLDASSDVRKHLLPFGAGTRVCVGEVFAMARLFLFTTTMVQHFHIKPGVITSPHDPRSYESGLILCPQNYEIIVTSRNI